MEDVIKSIYKISPYKTEYYNRTLFANEREAVYGEITQQSTDAIVNEFKTYFNENAVFYDLGCGLGKMVAHIGIKYGVKKSCGIELSKERIDGANYIKQNYCLEYNNISFINKSFFNCDLTDATVVYCDNTMYDYEFDKKIINSLPKGCLIILRKGTQEVNGQKVNKINKENFPTTYSSKSICYLIKE